MAARRPSAQLAIALVSLCFPAVVCGQTPPTPAHHSNKVFTGQYRDLFKTWESWQRDLNAVKPGKSRPSLGVHERKLKEKFIGFAIPERWFTDTFGPEQGPVLAKRYIEAFYKFEESTIRQFRSLMYEETAQVSAKAVILAPTYRMAATQSVSAPLPPVQVFRIKHFNAPRLFSNSPDRSLVDTSEPPPYYLHSYIQAFVYVDGAFRFAGSCGCPVWAPCSASNSVLEGDRLSPRNSGALPEPLPN